MRDRLKKLATLKPIERWKLIYQWVKTDVINQREFIELIDKLNNGEVDFYA